MRSSVRLSVAQADSSAFAGTSGLTDFAMQVHSDLKQPDPSQSQPCPLPHPSRGVQVVKDNPDMVKTGMQFAANNPGLAQQGMGAAASCAAQRC